MKTNITKTRIAGFAVLLLIAVGLAVLALSSPSVYADCKAIVSEFNLNGIDVEECSYNADTQQIKVAFIADTADMQLDARAIEDMRTARNSMRYGMTTINTVSNSALYNEVVKNASGTVLLDTTIDLMSIPPYPECLPLYDNIGVAADLGGLQEDVTAAVSAISECDFTYRQDIGNCINIVLSYDESDYDKINQDIAEVIRRIDNCNKENALVQQAEIVAETDGATTVFYSADLIYRDFLWWQAPEMSESWTTYY